MASFTEIINGDKPVLIDFHADWCGPCRVLSPIIQEVAKAFDGKVRVIKIDVDKNATLADKFQIQGVPTMMLFKDGKSVWRQSGVLQKDEIIKQIGSFS
ncbi:MAG: thioredoxin [Salibacteraceae bacterium]|nr:thioredoxin [Salibacteraceae bacterium]|tara:strand:- start:7823 stop:8119 length:297 start_codon:yes stop_codon:yes gene_type:complete